MPKRFLHIWFHHLKTDRAIICYPELKDVPFALVAAERGRMVIKAVNAIAEQKGIVNGMVVADARALLPALKVYNDKEGLAERLLKELAEWCLRYTPVVAVDLPEGLTLDISGCPHLWGGECSYLEDILHKLRLQGYNVRAAITDTIGAAWAVCHYGNTTVIARSAQLDALINLPPEALRIDTAISQRMQKLGLYTIGSFYQMPASALRRRFGQQLLTRLEQAIGQGIETLVPFLPVALYQERLPSLEPIRTATGIEIALRRLLESICNRLLKEEKGLRQALFKAYRVDGNVQQIGVGTNRPVRDILHLFKLFEQKIASIEPGLGIELFILEAPVVEELTPLQEKLWDTAANSDSAAIASLLDRVAGKVGATAIQRFLPDEHYWPERSFRLASSLDENANTNWRTDHIRPILLLPQPELIEVSVPIPDYPPMLFRYKGKLHKVTKADGPERIEREWWLEAGLVRDYYCVEDEVGARYWLFRSGHYHEHKPEWFIHGFFA